MYATRLPIDVRKKLLLQKEQEKDPMVICKFFDPGGGSLECYGISGEQMEYDFVIFGVVKGFEKVTGYFSLRALETCKIGLPGSQSLPMQIDLQFRSCHLSEIN